MAHSNAIDSRYRRGNELCHSWSGRPLPFSHVNNHNKAHFIMSMMTPILPKRSIMKVSTLAESLAVAGSSISATHAAAAASSSRPRSATMSPLIHQRRLSAPTTSSPSSSAAASERRSALALAAASANSEQQQQDAANSNTAVRRVHFNHITIREYQIQPSDNPAMINQPGLELAGWDYTTLLDSFPIDEYEQIIRSQQPQQLYRPSSQQQYHKRPIPPIGRQIILKEFGYTKEEIDDASNKAKILRMEREKSIQRMNYDWCDGIIEGLGSSWKFVKRGLLRGGQSTTFVGSGKSSIGSRAVVKDEMEGRRRRSGK